MHYVNAKSILLPRNGMNVYRGCLHGCIYCDSRSLCYNFTHLFEDIEVKKNAPELLEAALRKKRKKCMIGTGSMCDPYMPIEKTERITRRCLEIIEKYGFGATLITKSDAYLEDIDLLDRINRRAKAVVQTTLTTYDEDLCKIVEPHVATTRQRVAALHECRRRGIPTIVWLSPILPFINDTEVNLRGILDYCADAGVRGIIWFGAGMTLRAGDREYYYSCLDKSFPGLKQRYIERYGNAYEVQSPDNARLCRIFEDFCDAHGIMKTPDENFAYLHDFPQQDDYEQIGFDL